MGLDVYHGTRIAALPDAELRPTGPLTTSWSEASRTTAW